MWRDGSSKYQKIVATLVGLPALPALGYMLFIRNFRPHDWYYSLSIYISIGLTAAFLVLVSVLFYTNKWKPAPAWASFSPNKKRMTLFFTPMLIFYFYWINIGLAFPYLMTHVIGHQKIIAQEVIKSKHYSRYSCDYQIGGKELDRIFFEFCVSEEYFSNLPEVSFRAKFKVNNSFFGMIFEGVSLIDDANTALQPTSGRDAAFPGGAGSLDTRAMEISKYDIEERTKYISEAREATFLDAVFLINYYNRDTKRWGPRPKPEDITPQEVFGEIDEEAYKDALKKSQKLLSGSGLVGMAFFKYQSVTISYEDAIKRFRDENPGFSDKSYGLAINAGIRDMR